MLGLANVAVTITKISISNPLFIKASKISLDLSVEPPECISSKYKSILFFFNRFSYLLFIVILNLTSSLTLLVFKKS